MITVRTHLPATNGPFTRDDLDSVGDHTHQFEASDRAALESAGVLTETRNENKLRNNDLSLWTRGTTAVSLTHNSRIERADHWWARADYGVVGSGGAGTFATYERIADSAHQQWLHAAKLTGAAFTSNVDFGQDIPARLAAGMQPKITLTLEVENNTGAALTPTVRLDTCDTFESYGAVSNRLSQAVGSSVANAGRTAWNVTLDTSGILSHLRNGAQIYVRFAGLNDVAKSVKVFAAKLEIADSATTREVERDIEDPAGLSTSTTDARQYFDNPNFARWWVEEATCPEDEDSYAAPGFFANPSDGNTLVYKRTSHVPDTSSVYSAELTGDTAVTGSVDFGQNVPRAIAGEARRDVVLSVRVWNGTGGAITPSLRVDTCDAENTFDTVTNRIDELLSPCADSAWTTLTYTFDGSGVLDFENGARVYLRFPTACLNSVAKNVRIAQMRLERGTTAATFVPARDLDTEQALGAVARSLRVKWVDATHLDVSFDEIVLTDSGGRNLRLMANSYPGVSTGTNGANGLDYGGAVTASTWHYLWLASTGETSAAFLSKSATVPTLASGYTHKARIGAFYVNGSSQMNAFAIRDRRHYLAPALAISDTAPSAAIDTWEAIDVSNFVPPEAASVQGYAGIHSNADCSMLIAATADAIGQMTINGAPPTLASVINGFRVSAPFDVPQIETGNIYWQVHVKGGNQYRVAITGFVL